MKIRNVFIAFVTAISIAMSMSPANAGTARQFANIEVGWTKYHVENYIDDEGINVGSYTGSAGNPHIVKYYVVEDTGHGEWIDYRKNDEYWRVFDMWGDQA